MLKVLLLCMVTKSSANNLTFPKDFLFGVSSSAYQIEGAWNVDGKTPSVLDNKVHKLQESIFFKTSGDIACDSYHKIDEDVKNLKKLKVTFYRFSVSWTRILPTGFPNKINKKGIAYYNKLIDKLLQNGIKPAITIFHWDLPQNLMDEGGLINPKISRYFTDFARVCFKYFGDRVKIWNTMNEAATICNTDYIDFVPVKPYITLGLKRYLCGYYVLLTHAKIYHLYKTEFKHQKGMVGIVFESPWLNPENNELIPKIFSNIGLKYYLGWLLHPILLTGDYSLTMKTIFKLQLAGKKYPKFSESEKQLIKNSADYVGINHYSTFSVKKGKDTDNKLSVYLKSINLSVSIHDSWPGTALFITKVVPWGLRKLLNWIKDEYNNPKVMICENGFPGHKNGSLQDVDRQSYLKKYLKETLKALVLDNCNVIGYSYWSFMDSFEWIAGYSLKFGLYHVDFNDPDRPRTPRDSVKVYRKIITSRRIQ